MRLLAEEFNKELDENIESIVSKVMSSVSTFEEYKKLTGEWRGLNIAKDTFADILRNRLGENNDDDNV